jgi:pyruvate formate lyase activating enzyme
VPRETLVADIRRNALDDGPGIRSVVFFKGCVLVCAWCQNPETLSARRELQRRSAACLGCEACSAACERGAVRFDGRERRHDESLCELCGDCVQACPAGALRVVGTAYCVDELVTELARDEPFFRNSGGGVTLSGGEATLHLDYVAELAAKLRARAIHVLLETCGMYPAVPFEQRLLPNLDAVWFDLKLADPAEHKRHTGRDNAIILDNLARLVAIAPEKVLPRVPLVPGVTDGEDNLRAIAERVRALGFESLALLPYNPLWIGKRADLGLDLVYAHDRFMTRDEVERCRQVVKRAGVEPV